MVRKSPECFPTAPPTTPSYDCTGRNRVETSAQLVGDLRQLCQLGVGIVVGGLLVRVANDTHLVQLIAFHILEQGGEGVPAAVGYQPGQAGGLQCRIVDIIAEGLVGDPAAGGGEEILFVQDGKALHYGQDRRRDGNDTVAAGLRFGSTDNIPDGTAVRQLLALQIFHPDGQELIESQAGIAEAQHIVQTGHLPALIQHNLQLFFGERLPGISGVAGDPQEGCIVAVDQVILHGVVVEQRGQRPHLLPGAFAQWAVVNALLQSFGLDVCERNVVQRLKMLVGGLVAVQGVVGHQIAVSSKPAVIQCHEGDIRRQNGGRSRQLWQICPSISRGFKTTFTYSDTLFCAVLPEAPAHRLFAIPAFSAFEYRSHAIGVGAAFFLFRGNCLLFAAGGAEGSSRRECCPAFRAGCHFFLAFPGGVC